MNTKKNLPFEKTKCGDQYYFGKLVACEPQKVKNELKVEDLPLFAKIEQKEIKEPDLFKQCNCTGNQVCVLCADYPLI